MPEGSEIHLFAALINNNCKGKTFIKVSQSNWDKHPNIQLPWRFVPRDSIRIFNLLFGFRPLAATRGVEAQNEAYYFREVPTLGPLLVSHHFGHLHPFSTVNSKL